MKLSEKVKVMLERMIVKMKKILKALSLMVAAVLVLACFAGCTGGDGTDESSNTAGAGNTNTEAVSPALKDGVLKVGTNAEFPPFEFMDDNGNPDGFDMALMQEIGKVLGVKVEIENMEFKSLLGAMGNRIDVIAAGMTVDEERKEAVDFTDSYYTATQYVLVKKENGLKVTSVDDLKGKKIGVQEGTTGDFIATDDLAAKVSRYKKAVDAVIDLQNGRIDAVIIDKNPAQVFVSTYDTIEIVKTEKDLFDPEYYAIAVPKGDDALRTAINEALKTLKSNGKFDELVKAYIEK